jgi:D-lactate dehydrogenase (cytochrome)
LFGHIGDGHLHLNILPRSVEEFNHAKLLYDEFVSISLQLGGTLSAEHGVGKLKAHYLVKMYGKEGIEQMLNIKKVFDPKLILNRGNLIPKEWLKH